MSAASGRGVAVAVAGLGAEREPGILGDYETRMGIVFRLAGLVTVDDDGTGRIVGFRLSWEAG